MREKGKGIDEGLACPLRRAHLSVPAGCGESSSVDGDYRNRSMLPLLRFRLNKTVDRRIGPFPPDGPDGVPCLFELEHHLQIVVNGFGPWPSINRSTYFRMVLRFSWYSRESSEMFFRLRASSRSPG